LCGLWRCGRAGVGAVDSWYVAEGRGGREVGREVVPARCSSFVVILTLLFIPNSLTCPLPFSSLPAAPLLPSRSKRPRRLPPPQCPPRLQLLPRRS
jgi:hypothetical protein